MTPFTILETRRATHEDGECPACRRAFEPGQRIVLVRRGGEHDWVHVRHLAEHPAAIVPGDVGQAAMTVPALARCPERGCVWRFRSGSDRLCPQHADDDGLPERMKAIGIDAVPGQHDSGVDDDSDGNAADDTG
jgi:hypothetical protein